MKSIGLTARLILAVAFLTLLMIGIGLLGYKGMYNGEETVRSIHANQVLPLIEIKQVSDSYAIGVINDCHKIASGDLSWSDGGKLISTSLDAATQAWTSYLSSDFAGSPEEAMANAVTEQAKPLAVAIGHLQDILQKQDLERLKTFNSAELYQAIDPYVAKLGELSAIQAKEVEETIAKTEKNDHAVELQLVLALVGAFVIACILGNYLRRMAGDLTSLINAVKKSGIQVNISGTEIAATAKEQQATASEIAATTTEIGATSKEISATSRELVKTMGEVSSGAEQAATLAGSGQNGLGRMEETMRHIMDAAGVINAKLAVLNEKAGNVNQVVTTITKVADQTNLLSLNAAIEAEKAGEYGRGFAVVATEIRRLADQTAVATYDIEQMVKEMQTAVAAGVMGMDKFSEEVRRGVDEVRQVGTQLTQVIQHVQALTPRFESVNDGMQAQATGAQQISEALGQLSEAAQQTVESLRQSNLAIEQLNTTSHDLKASIESIKV